MPLTNEGLKVKEELSASLKYGRYLCLNGKPAFPLLGTEPSTSSSPRPDSAIRGLAAGSHCPQSTYSLRIVAREQGGKQRGQLGKGWLSAAELASAWGHLGNESKPRQQTLCQTHSAVTSVAPRMSAPCPGSSDSVHRRKQMPPLQGCIRSPLNTQLEQGRGISMSTEPYKRSPLLLVLLSPFICCGQQRGNVLGCCLQSL